MNINLFQLVITVIGITAVFSALLMTYYLKIGKLKNNFNNEKHIIELNKIREYYELQIYNLNNKMTTNLEGWKDLNHLVIAPNNNNVNYAKDNNKPEPNAFLKSFGITEEDLIVNPISVFVLSPFNKEMRETYNTIKHVCFESNLSCSRGDEELISGEILPHIVKKIANSRIIIANLDGRNPNVFYELGLAHALNKPTILLSKSIDHVPFDIKSKSIILYDSTDDLVNKLQAALLKTIVNT